MADPAVEQTPEEKAGSTVISIFLLCGIALFGVYVVEEWRTENWLQFHGWPLFWRFVVAIVVLYVVLFTPLLTFCDAFRKEGDPKRKLPERFAVFFGAGAVLIICCSGLGGFVIYAGKMVGHGVTATTESFSDCGADRAKAQADLAQAKLDCATFLKLKLRSQTTFTTKETLQRDIGRPAKPPFIIVDRNRYESGDVVDEHNYFELDSHLRPLMPEEVATVIWRQWTKTSVKEYASGRSGYVQHCTVIAIDWETKTVIAEQAYSGIEPKDNPNMRSDMEYIGYFDSMQTRNFINQLPLADAK